MRQPHKKEKFSKMGALYANPGRWALSHGTSAGAHRWALGAGRPAQGSQERMSNAIVRHRFATTMHGATVAGCLVASPLNEDAHMPVAAWQSGRNTRTPDITRLMAGCNSGRVPYQAFRSLSQNCYGFWVPEGSLAGNFRASFPQIFGRNRPPGPL